MLHILHLSDIHFGSEGNKASSRLDPCIQAVLSRTEQDSEILIVVTGDIAFSGKAKEYSEARNFFNSLQAILQGKRRSVRFAITPGNHDCDLGHAKEVRQQLLKKRDIPLDADILRELALPQTEYRAFEQEVAPCTQHNACLSVFEFKLDNSRITIQSINTAIYSQRNQTPGELLIPVETFTHVDKDAELHITLMHHPVGWLDAHQAMPVRRELQQSTDIILTGHEHAGAATALVDLEHDVEQLHFEGAAFQGERDDESEFFLVNVDMRSRRLSQLRFRWSGVRFEPIGEARMRPFRCNRLRARHYTFSRQHHAELTNLGVTITPEGRDAPLSLDDLFTYPDLIDPKKPPNSKPMRGEDLATFCTTTFTTVVVGPERSGKTSLAKRLFIDLAGMGYFPVYFPALPTNTLDLDRARTAFGNQYDFPDREEYAQTPASKKVIIIDDRRELTRLNQSLDSIAKFADHTPEIT
ncbi:MAG: metallophosphoesterase family protein [Myxococcota bacterium]